MSIAKLDIAACCKETGAFGTWTILVIVLAQILDS